MDSNQMHEDAMKFIHSVKSINQSSAFWTNSRQVPIFFVLCSIDTKIAKVNKDTLLSAFRSHFYTHSGMWIIVSNDENHNSLFSSFGTEFEIRK